MAAKQNNQPQDQPTKLYWQVITTDAFWGPPFPENQLPRYREPVPCGPCKESKEK